MTYTIWKQGGRMLLIVAFNTNISGTVRSYIHPSSKHACTWVHIRMYVHIHIHIHMHILSHTHLYLSQIEILLYPTYYLLSTGFSVYQDNLFSLPGWLLLLIHASDWVSHHSENICLSNTCLPDRIGLFLLCASTIVPMLPFLIDHISQK